VTCLEQYSKAQPGRRTRWSSRLGRLGSAAVAVAFIAGQTLTSARPASADQLQSAQAQAAQIASQIQAQGEKLAVLSEQYDQDQIRVQQLDQQVSQTEAQVAQTKTQVANEQSALRQLAITDYTTGGTSSGLEQLFTPGGERSAAVQEYQQVASASVSGAIDRLNQSDSVLNAQESGLQTTQSAARATLAAAQAARQSAQSELADQQGTLSKVKGRIGTLVAQRQAALAAAQAAAFQARLAAQQAAAATADAGLPSVPSAPNGGGAEAVAAAESQIGVPYVWAGSSPGVGFDCSGLTMWAWAHAGVGLSHSAADQYAETVHVPLSDLQPGDLLFYREGGTIGHVTMYVGPGEMVQAMETGTNIEITGIWTSGLIGAGRP
jgi:cell wall-associated NlpC family hydrolase